MVWRMRALTACLVGSAQLLGEPRQGMALAGEPSALANGQFLRDYAETRGFGLGRPGHAQPTPDGRAVLFLRSEARVAKLELFEFEVASGQTRRLLSPEE